MNKFCKSNFSVHLEVRELYDLISRRGSGILPVFYADVIRLTVLILICMKQRLCCNLLVLRNLWFSDSAARKTDMDLEIFCALRTC